MKRVEIIGNKSIEADLFDIFNKMNIVKYYTKIPSVHGIGSSGPRFGDAVWPEENFILIVYCDENEAKKIMKAIKEVKSYFKDEGLKLFESELVCQV
ncbi:MAG: hypothetical protein JXB50_15265 [Spirochaetes bacterium]|nr:hypothetical protein [Spirochaetota bacterium]